MGITRKEKLVKDENLRPATFCSIGYEWTGP